MLGNGKATIIFLLLISLLVSFNCQACSLTITSNQTIYHLGDNLNVSIDIENTKNEYVEFIIDAKLQHQNGYGTPWPITKSVSLQPFKTTTITLYSSSINQQFHSGIYIVEVKVYEDGFLIEDEHITFSLEDLPESMMVSVLISEKKSLSPQSRTFIKNNKIYFGLQTNSENQTNNVTLIYPNNVSETINLPTHIFATQPGIYTLHGIVSAEGYHNASFTEFFAVLNHTPFKESSTSDSMWIIISILIIISMLLIVIFGVWKKR